MGFQLKVGQLKVSFQWKGFGAVEGEFLVEGFSVEGEFFLLGFRLKVGFQWKGLSVEGEFSVEWVFI